MLGILLSSSMTLFFKFNGEKEELLISKWLFDETKLVVNRLPFASVKIRFNVILENPQDTVPFQ